MRQKSFRGLSLVPKGGGSASDKREIRERVRDELHEFMTARCPAVVGYVALLAERSGTTLVTNAPSVQDAIALVEGALATMKRDFAASMVVYGRELSVSVTNKGGAGGKSVFGEDGEDGKP